MAMTTSVIAGLMRKPPFRYRDLWNPIEKEGCARRQRPNSRQRPSLSLNPSVGRSDQTILQFSDP
eukprot:scaffold26046_cov158-Skeletonema_marinoi.AAC.1